MRLMGIALVLAVIGFVVKGRLDKANPDVIEHPVYAEMRVDLKEGIREGDIGE